MVLFALEFKDLIGLARFAVVFVIFSEIGDVFFLNIHACDFTLGLVLLTTCEDQEMTPNIMT